MKTLHGMLLFLLASSLMLPGFADTLLSTINPSDCGVGQSTDKVEILVSEVPGHSLITCDARIVTLNPSHVLFINALNIAAKPTNPWVTNPDSGESFLCRDSLDNCKLLYQHSQTV